MLPTAAPSRLLTQHPALSKGPLPVRRGFMCCVYVYVNVCIYLSSSDWTYGFLFYSVDCNILLSLFFLIPKLSKFSLNTMFCVWHLVWGVPFLGVLSGCHPYLRPLSIRRLESCEDFPPGHLKFAVTFVP